MKTLYLECNMGAAGDMLLAALYELLDDKQSFLDKMNGLGLPGVHLEPAAGSTCGIAGTHMRVTVNGEEEVEPDAPQDHHHHDHEHDHHHDHEHTHEHHDHEHSHEHEHHAHDHSHDHEYDHEHGHEHEHEHHHDHEHSHHHHHATPGHIADLIGGMDLPEQVRQSARAVYDSIAQAEALAHGCPVGDVHFHEVGALDAVADVTGVCYAMHLLGADRIIASPIHVGSGTVRCAHGVMPVPAPATAALLRGIPTYGGSIRGELCTPTGAALVAHFASDFGPMPPMAVEKIGIGVGTKVFEQANCVRVFLGESAETGKARLEPTAQAEESDAKNCRVFFGDQETHNAGMITELICNIDDMTPEALAFAGSRLLELGALDVYTVPGTMKKGRAGHVLTVLCAPEKEREMARHILEQTTTNGVRARRCLKYFLTPGSETVQTQWGPVRVKLAEGFGIRHAKPEFDDAAALAREHGIPIQTVLEDALRKIDKGGKKE